MFTSHIFHIILRIIIIETLYISHCHIYIVSFIYIIDFIIFMRYNMP